MVLPPRFACPLLSVVLKILFRSTWNFQLVTIYLYTEDRAASIFHSHLRLNFSTVNHDLFKKTFSFLSDCRLCGALAEDVRVLLFCRETLFASTAHSLGDKWLFASDKRKIWLPFKWSSWYWRSDQFKLVSFYWVFYLSIKPFFVSFYVYFLLVCFSFVPWRLNLMM